MQFRKEESEARGNHLDVMNSTTGKHMVTYFGEYFLMVESFLKNNLQEFDNITMDVHINDYLNPLFFKKKIPLVHTFFFRNIPQARKKTNTRTTNPAHTYNSHLITGRLQV